MRKPGDPAVGARDDAAAEMLAADQAASAQRSSDAGGTVQRCPLRQVHAIEVRVVGEDDAPLADIAVQLLRDPSSALRGKTDTGGLLRFDGLEAGQYQLGLYELDTEAWAVLETVPLDEPARTGTADAAWGPPVDAVRAECTHAVVQGECAAKIAYRYGLSVDTLWTWPANADLASRRDSAYVLGPGDSLAIPPLRSRLAVCATDMRCTLRRKGVPEKLDIQFRAGGLPRADVAWTLALRTGSGQVLAHQSGRTTADGRVQAWVPPDTAEAVIRITERGDTDHYRFAIGSLDPAGDESGAAMRLASMGFLVGIGEPDDATALAEAASRFQVTAGLPVTGKLDPATKAALKNAYEREAYEQQQQ